MLISEGVYGIRARAAGTLLTINCYLLTDGQDAYLVDTTWSDELSRDTVGSGLREDSWELLLGMFEEAHIAVSQLKGIVITHAHPDHMGYVRRLQQLCDAPMMLNPRELQENTILMQNDAPWRAARRNWFISHGTDAELAYSLEQANPKYMRVYPQRLQMLDHGQVIAVGRMRWEVIWCPGHAFGHICLLERQRRLLITGDHVLPHDTPIVMAHPALHGLHPDPLGNYLASLEYLAQQPVDLALPGHGRLIDDFPAVINKLLHHHDTRFNDALLAIGQGATSAYQIASYIPWVHRRLHFAELEPLDRWMAFLETVAHLRALEARGQVQSRVDEQGRILWALSRS